MAAAAPEVVALADVLAAAALFIAWAVCIGVLWAYRRSLKRIIVGFANLIDVSILSKHPLGGVSKWLIAQADNIDSLLGEAASAAERGASVLFKLFINIHKWIATEIADLATDVWHGIHGAGATIVKPAVRVLDAKTSALVRKLTVAVNGVTHVAIPGLRHRLDALAHRVSTLARSTAGAIAAPLPRIKGLERDFSGLRKRVKALEKKAGATVAAGFAVAVLAKSVVSWLRCPSLARNLKGRHCIDSDLLDALLTGTLLIIGTISLVEFAEEVGSVTEEAADLIHGFLRDA